MGASSTTAYALSAHADVRESIYIIDKLVDVGIFTRHYSSSWPQLAPSVMSKIESVALLTRARKQYVLTTHDESSIH